MGLCTTEAFVLRTYTLAEADKICVFLTKDHGKIRGVAHGARKMKSRFGSALEPLTQIALTYYLKESRDLVSVSTCDIIRSHFYQGSRDVETASAFSYISELLSEFIPDSEPDERLYRLTAATLDAIEQGKSLDWTLRYFETWLLRLGGFFPDVSKCSVCVEAVPREHPVFIAMDGTPRCYGCSNGRGMALNASLKNLIFRMLSMHPAAAEDGSITPSESATLGEINYQIIRHSLERDLRSRGPLRQLSAV